MSSTRTQSDNIWEGQTLLEVFRNDRLKWRGRVTNVDESMQGKKENRLLGVVKGESKGAAEGEATEQGTVHGNQDVATRADAERPLAANHPQKHVSSFRAL